MPRKISLFLVLAINAFALNGCMVTQASPVSTVPCVQNASEHGHTKTPLWRRPQVWAALGDRSALGPLTLQMRGRRPSRPPWLGYLYWFTPRQRVVLSGIIISWIWLFYG